MHAAWPCRTRRLGLTPSALRCANAERDDRDAAKLQVREQKTLDELKVFLRHLLEYIQWTRRTMRNYHILFHTRPDNVFAAKTRKLMNKIRSVL